jgi:hypothetical protein
MARHGRRDADAGGGVVTCPACRKPALRREELAHATWFEHESRDIPGKPARWVGCLVKRSKQVEMVTG